MQWRAHQKARKTTETTKVDDYRILSSLKKNPFRASSQVNNTLKEVGLLLAYLQSRLQSYSVHFKMQTTGNVQEQKCQIRLW